MWTQSREDIAAAFRDSDAAPVADAVAALARDAAIFASPPGAVNSKEPLDPSATSWVYGEPKLPATVDWPRDTWGRPMDPLVHVDLADVPELESWPHQPHTGALVFFVMQHHPDAIHDEGTVVYVPEGSHEPRPFPDDYGGQHGKPSHFGTPMYTPYPLEFLARGWTWPDRWSPTFQSEPFVHYANDFPQDELLERGEMDGIPQLQLLGHPHTIQAHPYELVERPDSARLLAQISVDVFVHYYVIDEADLAAQRFERITLYAPE